MKKIAIILTLIVLYLIGPELKTQNQVNEREVTMPVQTIVHVIGDSVTDGRYVPDGVYAWWRDGYFIRTKERICGIYCGDQVVKNAHGGGCLAVVCGGGQPAALTWVFSEVFNAVPPPTTVIMQMGTNDIGLATDQQIFDAYAALFFEAKARGIRWITGTIIPACSTMPGWSYREKQRNRVNSWIRANLGAGLWPENGGVADFDLYLRLSNGALNPIYSLANCTGGLNLQIHPGKFGAWEMTNAIPYGLIR